MRTLVAVALVMVGRIAAAGVIEVSPGPGTPLQDAVDAAAPGDRLLVQAGSYLETVEIAKSLRIISLAGGFSLGPLLGPLESNCDSEAVLDIQAGNVTIEGDGSGLSTGYISVQGGSAAAIRISGGARVRMKKVDGHSFCPSASGLAIENVSRVQIRNGAFTSYSSSIQGAPGCRIERLGGGTVMLKSVRCAGVFAGTGNYYGGPGLLVDDLQAAPGERTIKIVGGPFISCGNVAVELRATSGVQIKGAYLEACPLILGTDPNTAMALDAASSGNLVYEATLAGPIVDLGSGNCFRNNVDKAGEALPDECP
jgi:hypothetical protein